MNARKITSLVIRSNSILTKRNYSTKILCKNQFLTKKEFKFNATKHYTSALGALTKDQAHDLVFRLNDDERALLFKTLVQFQSNKDKSALEGQLASSRWRSRFGRPTKITEPQVDPTGAYCKLPEDWLQKKFVEATPPPKTNQLIKLMIINALPFIGFGFLDNFTMIIAGDYIEHTLGMIMTISTMAAAALGNTISDVLGIGSAVYVERMVEWIGIRPPALTAIQLEMKLSRRYSNYGRVLGITVGCLLGMIPLMFLDEKKKGEAEETDSPAIVVVTEETATSK